PKIRLYGYLYLLSINLNKRLIIELILKVWNLYNADQLYIVENSEYNCTSQENVCLFTASDHSINIYRIIAPNNAKKDTVQVRNRSKSTIKILKKASSGTK